MAEEHDLSFAAYPGHASADLVSDLLLTPQEFNRKFKDSPVRRTRRSGYLRNVAVALGNSKDPVGIPVLEKAIKDSKTLIREHAAWALNQIENK
jgi:epoxyqueuosine reductase